jgi:8-oxo-dGTP diphosphatase
VVVRQGKLLVIKRAEIVRAPGAFCFPGGGIEPGESEEQAVMREFQEELAAVVQPVRRLWHSVTRWGVQLDWWLAYLQTDEELVPNPAEVESVHWLTPAEMLAERRLLESNREFLDAIAAGKIELDLEAGG